MRQTTDLVVVMVDVIDMRGNVLHMGVRVWGEEFPELRSWLKVERRLLIMLERLVSTINMGLSVYARSRPTVYTPVKVTKEQLLATVHQCPPLAPDGTTASDQPLIQPDPQQVGIGPVIPDADTRELRRYSQLPADSSGAGRRGS